ncbi:MAG: hypothetical protein CMF43_05465 [Legionellales bacterium]|nr:hypothetical protein [Legionellales bacterium]
MSKPTSIDHILALIDRIKKTTKIANSAQFSLFAREIVNGLESRADQNTENAIIEHLVTWSWQLVQVRSESVSVEFHDAETGNEQSTFLLLNMVDHPFVVDTIRITINAASIPIQKFYNIAQLDLSRDESGCLIPFSADDADRKKELVSIFKLSQISHEEKQQLSTALHAVLSDVADAVQDWQQMQALMMEVVETWKHASKSPSKAKKYDQVVAFMDWMHAYYTYLGARCYSLTGVGGARKFRRDRSNALGVMKSKRLQSSEDFIYQEKQLHDIQKHVENNLFYMTKSTMKCGIHRDIYADLFVLRMLDKSGEIIGEVRFLGLLSSEAYDADPSKIPWIGEKIKDVVTQAKLKSRYSNKSLTHILKNIPTDELFQCTVTELKKNALAQLAVKGLRETRAIIRRDILGAFYTLTLLMPRDYYNSYVATKIRKIVTDVFAGEVVDWVSNFTDVDQVSMYLSIQLNPDSKINTSTARKIEDKITEIATPWWDSVMTAYRADPKGLDFNILMTYREFFGSKYRAKYRGAQVLDDIASLEIIKPVSDPEMLIKFCDAPSVYRQAQASWSLKIYQVNMEVILSDILPILENIGLSVIRENSAQLSDVNDPSRFYSIIDLHVSPVMPDVQPSTQRRQEMTKCIKEVLKKTAQSDVLNQLLITTDIGFNQINVLRALIYYAKQTQFSLSTEFMLQTVIRYPALSACLLTIFTARFSSTENPTNQHALVKKFETDLEEVASINEDKVYRRLLSTILATVRTNFFCPDQQALVLKLQPNQIANMPLPVPRYEAFVFSHRVVGTHLRMSHISRGGIRWSNRLEDYRTEVLGLMHAQQLKNAVIVPDGAKGVFVPKLLDTSMSREAYNAEGLACYKIFIGSILEISDNYHHGDVIQPDNMMIYDEQDPYFVVAADKGTATYSDTANALAQARGFWLSDAFASGGEHGYDHKKLGITAKGAWQSVRWHFATLGINPDHDHFTVVGIGDMSGDVFGNGMLLSQHISLLAAFDHRHIFVDPKPERKKAFQERKRLFQLNQSSWADYKPGLISTGGGVFNRNDKYVQLTDEMRELLGVDEKMLTPNELIRYILSAEVDLLWNGGIGTYIRASTETDADVQDIANDGARVDATEVRARVIAEGGNLGVTQRARVEYALNGGMVNTDFIDNVGGVSCSDIEVNIKIGLNQLVREGDIVAADRNALLTALQTAVETMILQSVTKQNFSLSAAEQQAESSLEISSRYIRYLEKENISNPVVDKLPTERTLVSRQTAGKSLVRPELAILYAHTKTLLVRELLKSSLVDDPYCLLYLYHAFPSEMATKYNNSLMQHALRREIIATEISDICINDMGLTFIQQMYDETRCSPVRAVKAYFIALEIFQLRPALNFIVEQVYHSDAVIALSLFRKVRELLCNAAWWLVQNIDLDSGESIKSIAEIFTVPVEIMSQAVAQYANEDEQEEITENHRILVQCGADQQVANIIAHAQHSSCLLNIVWALKQSTGKIERFMKVYYWIGAQWQINWLREQVNNYQIDSIWTQIGRRATMADIDRYQRVLVNSLFSQIRAFHIDEIDRGLAGIVERQQTVYDDWMRTIAHMQSLNRLSFSVFSVAILRLKTLCDAMTAGIEV